MVFRCNKVSQQTAKLALPVPTGHNMQGRAVWAFSEHREGCSKNFPMKTVIILNRTSSKALFGKESCQRSWLRDWIIFAPFTNSILINSQAVHIAKANKKADDLYHLLSLAPTVGLEPTTSWLTVKRSTDWAMREYLILF